MSARYPGSIVHLVKFVISCSRQRKASEHPTVVHNLSIQGEESLSRRCSGSITFPKAVGRAPEY